MALARINRSIFAGVLVGGLLFSAINASPSYAIVPGDPVPGGSGTLYSHIGSGPDHKIVTGLQVGATYKFVMQGTFSYGVGSNVDPAYAVGRGAANPIGWNGGHIRPTPDSYNAGHSYNFYWTANSTQMDMMIGDSKYTDNTGGFSYNVYLSSYPAGFCTRDVDCTAPQVCDTATNKCVAPPDKTAPTAPLNLQANAVSTSQINLAWDASTDNVGVTGYKIFRDSVQIATTTTKSYQNTGLTANTTYAYTVSAYDAAGNDSVKSNVATAKTSGGDTLVSLDLFLHGIGKAGDSVTPGAAGGGNMSPSHPLRLVTVQLLDAQNAVKANGSGYVTFQPTGNFTGKINMGPNITTGSYIIKVKFTQSLNTQAPGFYTVTVGAETAIPQFSLVTVYINNDGAVSINIQDYNILRGCYSYFQPPVDCDADRKQKADLDDDGNVNQSDLNLFLRELSYITI